MRALASDSHECSRTVFTRDFGQTESVQCMCVVWCVRVFSLAREIELDAFCKRALRSTQKVQSVKACMAEYSLNGMEKLISNFQSIGTQQRRGLCIYQTGNAGT